MSMNETKTQELAKGTEQNQKGWNNPFLRIGLSLFIMTVLVNAIQYGMAFLIQKTLPAFADSSWYTYVLVIVSTYVVGAPVVIMLVRSLPVIDKSKREKKPLKWYTLPLLLCASLLAMYLFSIVGVAINYLIGMLVGGTSLNPLATALGGNALVPTVITVAICAPIVEELLFREVILERLRVYGDMTAILVSALCFGLLHGNIQQILYATALGVIFGYVKVRTNDIRYTIGLHMGINLIGSVVIANLALTGNQYIIMVAGMLIIGICMVGLIAFILGFALKWVDFSKLSKGEMILEHPVRKIFGNVGMILYLLISIVSCVLVILSMRG